MSNELLHDSAFDIAGHIANRFGVRFGNAEEDAFILELWGSNLFTDVNARKN